MQTDIRTNWRKAVLGRRDPLPPLTLLQAGMIRSNATSVFLPFGWCGDQMIAIRDWTAEYINQSFILFSRIQWVVLKYDTQKLLIGYTFDFSNSLDYLYFKLRWFIGGQSG